MPHRKLLYKRKPNSDYLPLSILWNHNLEWSKNVKLLLLELFFSKQLTKILVDTAVAKPALHTNPSEYLDANLPEQGMVAELSKFLPATMLTRVLEPHLIEVLFHKYWQQYSFMMFSKCTESNYLNDVHTDDITNVYFQANKENLHQISPYLSKLDLVWHGVEVPSALGLFAFTHSVSASLALAAILEFIKRMRL